MDPRSLLDICSGTGSVSRVAREMGWNTTTLDNDPKTNPDILMNVLDYVPSGNWDFVWCSPPCTEYSIALTTRKRDLLTADKISQRCLEIIEYFKQGYTLRYGKSLDWAFKKASAHGKSDAKGCDVL